MTGNGGIGRAVVLVAAIFAVLAFATLAEERRDRLQAEIRATQMQATFLLEEIGRLKGRMARLEAELASARQGH